MNQYALGSPVVKHLFESKAFASTTKPPTIHLVAAHLQATQIFLETDASQIARLKLALRDTHIACLDALKEWQEKLKDATVRSLVKNELSDATTAYFVSLETRFFPAVEKQEVDEMHEALAELNKLYQAQDQLCSKVSKAANSRYESMEQLASSSLDGISWKFGIGYATVTLACLAALYLLCRSILQPIAKTEFLLKEVGEGHLGRRSDIATKCEIGSLTSRLNTMLDSMCHSLLALSKDAEQVAEASEEISQVGTSLMENAAETAGKPIRYPKQAPTSVATSIPLHPQWNK